VANALFYRPLLEDLRCWRDDPNRKPLIVRGACQVGKSCLVRLFAGEYPRYAELNLEKPSHAALFRRGLTLAYNLHPKLSSFIFPCEARAAG